MKQALYGYACAFLLALTWLALDARIAVLRASADLGMVAANSNALMRQMANTTQEQGVYWRATSLQTSRLIGQARHSLDGVNDAVKSVNDSAVSLNQLVQSTNVSLNAKNGVLPKLAETTNIIGSEAIEVSAHSLAAMDEGKEALHSMGRAGTATAIAVEQATGPAVSTVQHVDAVAGHVAHVAEHYDASLTAKQTPWQKIKSALWIPVKVALRVW